MTTASMKARKKSGDTAQRFPTRLRSLREERGWTQTQLAKRLGIKRSSIANYEYGMSYPPLPVLERIATVFGVTLDGLVWGDNNQAEAFQDRELFEFFRKVDALDFRARDTLKEMVLALLARYEVPPTPRARGQA